MSREKLMVISVIVSCTLELYPEQSVNNNMANKQLDYKSSLALDHCNTQTQSTA